MEEKKKSFRHSCFRLAIVQHNANGSIAENAEQGERFVREAAGAGADMILFPECFLSTYSFPEECLYKTSRSETDTTEREASMKQEASAEREAPEKLEKEFSERVFPSAEELEKVPEFRAWCEAALTEESAEIRRFQALAEELSVGIVITGFTKGKRYPQNSAFLIDRTGRILMKYSKVHTCDFDWERYLESGEKFSVCQFDGITIGLMICYDREYPESARELGMQGAELILVPNDCGDMPPRLMELQVHAMENMTGIAMANTPGARGGCSCAYNPMVWDAQGNVINNTIVVAEPEFDGILYAEFDIDAIREHREREDLGKYRKPQAYQMLRSQADLG